MKFSLALSFLVAGGAAAASSNFALNKEFMAAMHGKPQIQKASKAGKMKQLQERLLKASRKLDQAQQNSAAYYGQNGQAFLADQDGNLYFQGNDGLYYDVDGQQVQPNENGLYPWEYNAIPYNLASRSFKYAGCAAIKTYDTERGYENGNPMVVDNFAVFRLCPSDHCNEYSATGCSKNYGEYAVDIKTYLLFLLNFYEEEYENFCGYCEPCDSGSQTNAKSYLQECHQVQANNEFQYYSDLRAQAYQDYQDANAKNSNGWSWFGSSGKSSVYNNGNGFDAYDGSFYNGASGSSNTVNYPSGYYNNNNNGNRLLEQNNGQGDDANQQEGDQVWQDYMTYVNDGMMPDGTYAADRDEMYENNSAYQSCTAFVQGMQAQYLQAVQAQGGNADYSNGQAYGGYNNYNAYQQAVNNGQEDQYYQNANNAQAQNNYYDEDGNYQAYQNSNLDSSMYDYWMGMSCCQDGSVCDACQVLASEQYGFCDEYVCGEYYTYCSDQYSQNQEEVDLTQFLECTAYENGNGQQYYIGPHCGSDHFTIGLGIFSDENCVNYIGDSVSLKQVLGYQHSDAELFQFPETCISCDGLDEYAEFREEAQEGRYGEYYAAPDSAMDTSFAMCTSLYMLSAQCNEKMSNYEQVSRLMTTNEKAEEDRSCTFIDNIIGGSFDETGEIVLKDSTFNWNDIRNRHQYGRIRMPAGQALLLSFSIIAVIATAAMAYSYTRAFRREGMESPWSPTAIFRKRHGKANPATDGQTRPSISVTTAKEGAPVTTPNTDPDGNYVMMS